MKRKKWGYSNNGNVIKPENRQQCENGGILYGLSK